MFNKNIELHELINTIITILDARDPYTFSHSFRVAELSVMIAESMKSPDDQVKKVHIAAHLHDIGKIGVADRILNKTGRLTRAELVQLQAHPVIGSNMLKKLSIFRDIADIVLYHHERYDGLGYPAGIKGDNIPLESRIIAVADTFDAITSDRPYRQAQSYAEGFHKIGRHSGTQFSPEVVEHFMTLKGTVPARIDKIQRKKIIHIAFVGHEELIHSRRVI